MVRAGGYYTPKSEIEVSSDLGKVEWVALKQSDDDPLTYAGPEEKPSPRRSRDCRKIHPPLFDIKSFLIVSTSDAAHKEESLNAISQIGTSFDFLYFFFYLFFALTTE